jgi:hypothetical protein
VVIHYTVLRKYTEKGKEGERNNCVRRKNENERTEGGGIEREKKIKWVVRRQYERNKVMKCVGRKEGMSDESIKPRQGRVVIKLVSRTIRVCHTRSS